MILFQILKNKKYFTSFLGIGLIQAGNYLIPFFLYPFIAKKIGVNSFGIIGFSQAFITYFNLIINYGFDFTATRDISINRNNRYIVNEIVSKTLSSKIYLFAISTAIFTICLISSNKLQANYIIHIYSFLITIGFVLFPVWIFQGFENVVWVSIFNFVIKIISALLIIYFLSKSSDYNLVAFFLSVSQIFIGLFALYWAVKKYKISFTILSISNCFETYKSGFFVFLSSIVINLYTTTNVVLLGLISGEKNAGLFSASSRVINAILGLTVMTLSQVIYPVMSKKIAENRLNGFRLLFNYAKLIAPLAILSGLLLYFFSDFIILTLFGANFLDASNSLKIIAFLPFVIALSNIFCIQGLINLGLNKLFLLITICGALLSLVLNIILIPKFNFIGASFAWLITETFITILSFIFIYNQYKKEIT